MKQILKTSEFLLKEVTRRNLFLNKFFEKNDVEVTLMGNSNNPLIVMKDNLVLSCYVHNFELIFKNNTHNGIELFRVKLKNNPEVIKENLLNWIKTSRHRKIYFFKANDFYFVKHCKLTNNDTALFSSKKEMAYYVFNKQKAIEMIKQLQKEEPLIEIAS